MSKPVIKFTKKVLPLELRRSSMSTEHDSKLLREAVVTASRVSAFYYKYQERAKQRGEKSNIMPRDATQILAQMGVHKLFICEQVDIPDPAIVASSILWEFELPIPSSSGYQGYDLANVLEIGTQVSDLYGYQLQWILTAVTLLERLVYDPSGIPCAATYGDNTPVEKNFVKNMKFVNWDDIPATLSSWRINHIARDGEESRGAIWLRPTIDTINAAAELIIDLYSNPERKGRENARTTAGQAVPEIRFEFDQAAFKLADFDVLMQAAERIRHARPSNLEELRIAIENPSISEDFLQWTA